MKAERSRTGLAAGALLLMPLLVYLPLRSAGFIWDDDSYVTQNQNLRSLAGLLRTWFEPRSIPQYYPLVHTSYWIEFQLWGLSATGYHVTNVLLHGLNTVLLWRIFARLRLPGAWLAAAIFAVHPVMVESVAWITERKNVLSLALALLAFGSYLRFAPLERDRRDPAASRFYAFSLLFYVGALLSKTVVCSLPAVILVVRWWKRGRIRVADVLPLVPFFALGVVAALTTVWLEKHHVGAVGEEWALDPFDRFLLAGRALWFYAAKLVWPHPLVFFYPRWQVDAAQLWQWSFPIAAGIVAATLWGLRGRIGRGPLAAVVVFAGVLVPALGFFDVFPFRYSYVADHFQYHAAPALIALFAAGAAGAVARLGPRARIPSQLAAFALLLTLGTLAFRETHEYHDLDTLYRRTIADNPSAWNAHLNLANLLSNEGRNAEALPFAREATQLAPEIADAHNTLGGVLFLSVPPHGAARPAQLAEAIDAFQRALEIDPGHIDALYNGAVALSTAGRHEEASRFYARILAIQPAELDALVGLGVSLAQQGRLDEAETPIHEALKRAPARADAQQALTEIAARRKRTVAP